MKRVFNLNIVLGDDAMQSGRDVGGALAKVAHRIEDNTLPLTQGEGGTIRDLNGNFVGTYEVEEVN